jgi:hypothetical protein
VLQIELDGEQHHALALIRPELPGGVAALSVGLPGIAAFALPAWLKIRRARNAVTAP